MQYQALSAGHNRWPTVPTIGDNNKTTLSLGGLGAVSDVNVLQVTGAVGGGILGAIIMTVATGVTPKKYRNWSTVASIGVIPAMAIAGWFLFKEGTTYEFSEEEVYG